MSATQFHKVQESHVATSLSDDVSLLHVARHRSNEMTSAAIEKTGRHSLSVGAWEQTFSTTDPVVSPWRRSPLTVPPDKQEVLSLDLDDIAMTLAYAEFIAPSEADAKPKRRRIGSVAIEPACSLQGISHEDL